MSKQKKKIIRIAAAFIIFACLLIAEHIPGSPAFFENRWISLILYLIPFLICGYDIVFDAVYKIRKGQLLDESFLMTLASVGAFITGQTSEACAVMLFFQTGEAFQDHAVNKSRRSISELMDIAPEFANIMREDGTVETTDPDYVEIGDILLIKPGENIPVDGCVTEGEGYINTSALTGESLPIKVSAGSQVLSGCINGETTLKIKAEKLFEDSTVSRILELVENAAEKKSRTENFITRFARYYTPIVVVLAVLIAVVPSIIFRDPFTWIYRACTFLVISCPCALVISVPLAFFAGVGQASKNGVLVKGSNYLELLADIDTLVTDKTGTLTKGTFKVTRVVPAPGVSEETVLKTAAIAESGSTHPIAVSISEAYKASGAASHNGNDEMSPRSSDITVTNVSGKGIIAKDGTSVIYAGTLLLLKEAGIVPDEISANKAETLSGISTIVHIAENDKYLGAIYINDEIKPEARQTLSDIRKYGVRRIIMLTGDRKETGEAIGKELGLDETFCELLPQDKVSAIESVMKGSKGKTAYAGDGINDAPVLSRCDVGIAMGSMGSDAAIEAADVVIMDDDLSRLPKVMKTASKTVGIAKQNIVFALAVKILILLLGAFGIANMWAAVFADVGVALICILNSMRLLTGTGKS